MITENQVCEALLISRGDLFVASGYLNITPLSLDRFLRRSDEVRRMLMLIKEVKKDDQYNKLSKEQFQDKFEEISRAYRIDATEEIYKLAMMRADTAAMAKVKLDAAVVLRGEGKDAESSLAKRDENALFEELRQAYATSAPRIKSIRVDMEFNAEDFSAEREVLPVLERI